MRKRVFLKLCRVKLEKNHEIKTFEQSLNIREVNAKIALLESIDSSDETRKLFKAN